MAPYSDTIMHYALMDAKLRLNRWTCITLCTIMTVCVVLCVVA